MLACRVRLGAAGPIAVRSIANVEAMDIVTRARGHRARASIHVGTALALCLALAAGAGLTGCKRKRGPVQLSAPAAATYSASQQPFTLPVELTNSTGGSISSEGMYFLSFHLLSPDGEMLRHDNTRSKLAELKDGETTTVQMIVDPVPAPGTYLLEVDVVHELVTWMGWNGTERPRVRFTVP